MSRKKIVILADVTSYISKSSYSPLHAIYGKVNATYTRLLYSSRVVPFIKNLEKCEENEVVVIGLDDEAQKELRGRGIQHRAPDDYLTEKIYRKIDEKAMELVRKLPHLEGNSNFRDATAYQGISLWDVMELEVWASFVKIIKAYELLEHIISVETPDKVVVIDDEVLHGKLMKTMPSENVQILTIQPKLISNLKSRFINYSMPHVFRYLRRRRRIKPTAENLDHIDDKPMKNKILVGYFGRFSYMIASYAKELKKNDKNEIIVLGKSDIMGLSRPTITHRDKDKFKGEGIAFKAFEEYMTEKIYERVDGEARSLEKKWDYLKRDKNFESSVTYKDFELWDLVEYKLLFLFFVRFPKLIEEIEVMKRVINIEKPSIIVSDNDRSPFAKMLFKVGNLTGLPTLIVEHAITTDHPIYGPTSADKIAVIGEYMKRVRIKRGVNPNQIVITGQPRYDILTQKNRFGKESIYKQLKIDPDKRIILFAAGHSIEVGSELLIRGIYEAVKKYPEMVLVVKPHPGDSDKLYREIAGEAKANVVITFDYLYELLHACDILITTYSTVGLEAMIVDKPVITINLTNKPDRYPYAESGAAIGVYTPEDIAPAIKKALYDSETRRVLEANRKKFVYEHAYKMDGLASRRVADLIEKMIEI